MIDKVNYCFIQTLTNGNTSVTVFDVNSSAPQRSYEITSEGNVKIMFDKENTLNKNINNRRNYHE